VPDLLALLSAFCAAGRSPKWVLRRRPRKFGGRQAERERREREQSQAGTKAED
jgi:hypothetical protein